MLGWTSLLGLHYCHASVGLSDSIVMREVPPSTIIDLSSADQARRAHTTCPLQTGRQGSHYLSSADANTAWYRYTALTEAPMRPAETTLGSRLEPGALRSTPDSRMVATTANLCSSSRQGGREGGGEPGALRSTPDSRIVATTANLCSGNDCEPVQWQRLRTCAAAGRKGAKERVYS